MHSQSSSPSLFQGSFVPFHEETAEPMCVTQVAFDDRSVCDQEVLRQFIPMPYRHCHHDEPIVRPMRQTSASTSHMINMFDHLTHTEETESNASTSPNVGINARLKYQHSSSRDPTTRPQDHKGASPFDMAMQSGHNADVDSRSSPHMAPSSVPHDMIDWTLDVTLDASSLPIWEDPAPATRSINVNVDCLLDHQSVEEDCIGDTRRKLIWDYTPRPPLSKRSRHNTPPNPNDERDVNVEEPRKRRKRCI
ncbi:uncharacterized protein MELLADRAFT_108127 [Melampsora larici-populina 98AG31]|uniref:Uncharacterized protein n=1 Tax=Melampsora larici-populina (strain 98AG31 / pathotype 3-4-7) TaxID=747676 RepID=F4RS21_MELLP|nr:uncharacterized protein MELLADRAFT_108127 [Melampsora larici-populina 98AG31]EGG04780.1 hypothetical protein MELLADRAFT_108127 [Melampsora larici-populina 98AG31]